MQDVKRDYRTFPEFGPDAELITLEELKAAILYEDEHILVLDKPGWIVCHPSKNGPFSSLVGAVREYTELDTLHLINRLDRETSGLIFLAKNKKYARLLQGAIEDRLVTKVYYTILEGHLENPIYINQPLARDMDSPVYVKVTVRKSNSAQKARSYFEPLISANGFTLTRVVLDTGRKHQIRAHAQWLGHRVVGDKIYGPNAELFLEFAEKGWTDRLEQALPMRRQAIHAFKMTFRTPEFQTSFVAPLAWDVCQFCQHRMGLTPEQLLTLQNVQDLPEDLFEKLKN